MSFIVRMKAALFATAIFATTAVPASAHVKWFNSAIKVSETPAPLANVFTPVWAALLAAFLFAGILALIFDRTIGTRHTLRINNALPRLNPDEMLRVGLGAFFLCLWVRGGILLTPELTTTQAWVPWFELSLALATLSWRTTWIASAGTFVLYGLAMHTYGLFHLLDYPIFLGIAVYLAIHSLRPAWLLPYAGSILVVTVSATLMWASMEKWAYPDWLRPILHTHPEMTFGMDHDLYMTVSGFVEFFLAAFLLVGRFFGRVAAVGLIVLFVGAIPVFGKVDAIGHLMIVLALIAIILQGEQHATRHLSFSWMRHSFGTGTQTGSILAMLCFFVTAYYGLHAAIYHDYVVAKTHLEKPHQIRVLGSVPSRIVADFSAAHQLPNVSSARRGARV
jgi:hypothetical protein